MEYVYLLNEENTNKYKIGKTKDVLKRKNSLQTGNASDLKLIVSFETINASTLEKIFHGVFKDNNISREWFKFNSNDLFSIIAAMINIC